MVNLYYRIELRNRRQILKFPWRVRVWFKRLLLKGSIRKLPFCKDCGKDVRDFIVTKDIWSETMDHQDSCTVCVHCFVERRAIRGLNPVPRLVFEK